LKPQAGGAKIGRSFTGAQALPVDRTHFPALVPPSQPRGDETDYAQRHFQNLVSAAVLLFLAFAMAWTAGAFFQHESERRCYDSGRKDCAPLPAHPKAMRATSH
jgi:hypothetical protein